MLMHDMYMGKNNIWNKTYAKISPFLQFSNVGCKYLYAYIFSRFKTSKSEPDIPNSRPAI